MARSAGGEGLTIGVLAPLLAGTYNGELLTGIIAGADAAGHRLVAVQTLDPSSAWDAGHPQPELQTFGARLDDSTGWPAAGSWDSTLSGYDLHVAWDLVDGFVAILESAEPRHLEALRRAGKPVVLIGDDIPGFEGPVVRTDNRSGIASAIAHLIEHGHRRIAFVGSDVQADIRDRHEAYREALRAHGVKPDDALHFVAPNNLESGGAIAAMRMRSAGVSSTAVVAGTDFNAIGILKVLTDAGLRLPEDQALVGFDDVDAASSVRPALSTVRQDVPELGRMAVGLLARTIRGEAVPGGTHLVPTRFVARESCGCTVAQVAGASATSPRRAARSAGRATSDDAAARRLRHGLAGVLRGGSPLTAEQSRALDGAVHLLLRDIAVADAVAGDGGDPPACRCDQAARELLSVNPHWSTLTATVACLERHRRAAGAGGTGRGDAGFERYLRHLVLEMSRRLAELESTARTTLQLRMDAEHSISTSIIRGSIDDPSSLQWLGFTTVRAGCLGQWTGGGEEPGLRAGARDLLAITASFQRGGGSITLPRELPIEAFPPREIIALRRPGEIVAVIPVKTVSMDLGLLAMVTPTTGTAVGGRDRLFEKGALLGMSMQRELITEQLRRSNADLATFSHAMAHDLRSPLATISMWASVARSRAGPDDRAEPVLAIVDRIREVAGYSTELITNLLRYAELDRTPAPAEPVDLNLVVGRAVVALESLIQQSGAIIDSGDLPTVSGDFVGLGIVLENLIGNAIKYRGAERPRVRIQATSGGRDWTVTVRDNGTGIPAELTGAVFQPFVRGVGSTPGSGLGLATCRRIVEGLGGRIWVDGSGAEGTVIAFTLPAESPRATARRDERREAGEGWSSSSLAS